jgi:DNA replication and repair protein RecF
VDGVVPPDQEESNADRSKRLVALEGRFLEAIAKLRPKEIERGINLVGPHRDDLKLGIGDLPARGYASHGESWSLALALKMGAFGALDVEERGSAVLILDDVFAELDAARRKALATMVAEADQVIVTAAVSADIPPELEATRYNVAGGGVQRVC